MNRYVEPSRVPVMVTYTMKHVVWVESPELEDGESLKYAMEQAKRTIECQPYEYTDDRRTLADAGWDVEVPTDLDFRFTIYGYGDGHPGGPHRHDAHIEAHRAEMWRQKRAVERAECQAAGHPNLEKPIHDGRCYCPGCGQYLTPEQAGGVASHA